MWKLRGLIEIEDSKEKKKFKKKWHENYREIQGN